MDPHGNIYRGENVPPEDEARLDGYLLGRAEQTETEKRKFEDMLAEVERAKAELAAQLRRVDADVEETRDA